MSPYLAPLGFRGFFLRDKMPEAPLSPQITELLPAAGCGTPHVGALRPQACHLAQ